MSAQNRTIQRPRVLLHIVPTAHEPEQTNHLAPGRVAVLAKVRVIVAGVGHVNGYRAGGELAYGILGAVVAVVILTAVLRALALLVRRRAIQRGP